MLLELTAGVRIPRREIENNSQSFLRNRYYEEIAMEIARALMRTSGAVEITEEMEPSTGDVVMQARCFVEDSPDRRFRGYRQAPSIADMVKADVQASNKKAAYEAMLDAVRYNIMPGGIVQGIDYGREPDKVYFSKPMDPLNFGTVSEVQTKAETLTLEALEKAMKVMDAKAYDPIAFLQTRVQRKKEINETKEQFEARQRAEQEIAKSTKKAGGSLGVTVKVRKIQMPDE